MNNMFSVYFSSVGFQDDRLTSRGKQMFCFFRNVEPVFSLQNTFTSRVAGTSMVQDFTRVSLF